jgi:replication factor C subunit 2/4
MSHHLWVEKYRPKKLHDISSQNIVINTLMNVLVTKKIPHLLFHGPSGCGKTSTILALAQELFGDTINTNRIIELNASDERGINVIRDKIKKYAKQIIKSNKTNTLPPWKLIILDEADTMTSDSQFALRRIMEQYSRITRFCIICNYHTKIIDPIISRCSVFYFRPINDNEIIKKLEYICNEEKLICSRDLLLKIIKLSRGDLRRAINYFQKCYNTYGNVIINDQLDEISGIIPQNTFDEMMQIIYMKDTIQLDKIVHNIHNSGYSLVNQILLFHDTILNMNIDCNKKANILFTLATIDHSLIKGCNEYIQFMKLVYYIMKTI